VVGVVLLASASESAGTAAGWVSGVGDFCIGTGPACVGRAAVKNRHLGLAGGPTDDDPGSAVVLGGLRYRVDLGGEHAPGVHAVAGQDAGGEPLPDLHASQRAGGGGLGDQENVHAQLAAHVEESLSAPTAGETFGSQTLRLAPTTSC
jgi:hypothetical protein